MRPIALVVVHCSDSPDDRTLYTGRPGEPGFRDPAEEIDAWHRERGFARPAAARMRFNRSLTSIGYHYVIARNGAILTGRHPDEVGAHAVGHNANSLGVCLVGRSAYTPPQWAALRTLIEQLCAATGTPRRFAAGADLRGVCGHRDLPAVTKTCPGFPVADWLRGALAPLPDHTAPEIVR